MDILLIRPPRPPKAITIGEFMYCEPLGLEAVYGVLRHDFQILLVDMMVEKIDIAELIRTYQPKCIGLTSICIDVVAVLDLAAKIRITDHTIKIVVGGTQAQLNPSAFFSGNIDYILAKATGAAIHSLFRALVGGTRPGPIDGVYDTGKKQPLHHKAQPNEFLPPDRTSTRKYRHHYSYFGYRPCALLQTSQGCSKRCVFCLRWHIEGGAEKHRDIDSVCAEVAAIEEKTIMIIDNDFLCSGSRIDSLCNFLEMRGIQKNFLCYGSVASILANKEQVTRFGRNGLKAVLVGYESFSDRELATYKKQATLTDSLQVSRLMRSCGIDVWASFIMHPDWSHEDFAAFRKHIRRLRPEISSLTPLTAFPGTLYYEKYKDRLLISKENYPQWSFAEVTIAPKNMSLRAYYFEVLRTNLHINLFMNNGPYLVRKFGWQTMFRLFTGGLKLSIRYLILFAKSL